MNDNQTEDVYPAMVKRMVFDSALRRFTNELLAPFHRGEITAIKEMSQRPGGWAAPEPHLGSIFLDRLVDMDLCVRSELSPGWQRDMGFHHYQLTPDGIRLAMVLTAKAMKA